MRVLHVIPCLAGGGAERQLQYLINSSVLSDLEVHVAYIDEGGHNSPHLKNVTFHKLRAGSNYDPGLIVRLFLLIRRVDPHLVQSWLIQSDILSAIACLLSKKKWLLRESNAPSLRRGNHIKFIIRKALTYFSESIISNSAAGLSYWKSIYPEKKHFLIENGFPIQDIEVRSRETLPSGLRNELGQFVLFVGRLEEQKNVHKIIQAMVLVQNNFKLVVCGDGNLYNSLRHLTTTLGIEGRVVFLGRMEEGLIYSLMSSAKGIILNSHFEGFPNVAVEAIICRCPLVLSDIQPHRAILDSDSATFVNKDDVCDVAKALDGLISEPKKKRKKANNAYEIVRFLSVEYMASKYRKVYEQLLGDSIL